ncbi:MAG: hypothetical protein F4066_00215 [Chloroflexi bacterium]|nr:hypothetical protein [Chloroflexota bacterium]MYI03274.1 hypothetical protein [Chloroflexota bacterium]
MPPSIDQRTSVSVFAVQTARVELRFKLSGAVPSSALAAASVNHPASNEANNQSSNNRHPPYCLRLTKVIGMDHPCTASA